MFLLTHSCRWTEAEKEDNDFCIDGATYTDEDGMTYCNTNSEDEEEMVEVQCVEEEEEGCECGPVKEWANERIVGGGEAPKHAYPWQISILWSDKEWHTKISKDLSDKNIFLELMENINEYLEYAKKQSAFHICGGSIISSKYILTAAHCFHESIYETPLPEEAADQLSEELQDYYFTPDEVFVLVGAHYLPNNDEITSTELRNNKNIHRVREIIIHDQYDPPKTSFQYDFTILKLESILKFSSSVAAVCLPDPKFSASKYVGRKGVVSGWGNMDMASTTTSLVLKDLDVIILSNEECREVIENPIPR